MFTRVLDLAILLLLAVAIIMPRPDVKLHHRLTLHETERDRVADQHRDHQLGGGDEEQSEDYRYVAERDGMRFASQVQIDGQHLARADGQRDQRPGQLDRGGQLLQPGRSECEERHRREREESIEPENTPHGQSQPTLDQEFPGGSCMRHEFRALPSPVLLSSRASLAYASSSW